MTREAFIDSFLADLRQHMEAMPARFEVTAIVIDPTMSSPSSVMSSIQDEKLAARALREFADRMERGLAAGPTQALCIELMRAGIPGGDA